jgi:hypothetical protein
MKRFAIILVCLVAVPLLHAQDAGVKQSITYVQKLQTDLGGFLANEPKAKGIKVEPTLRATSAAVRALTYLGGDVPKKDACIKFVERCWNAESGGFSDEPKGKPDVFSTAVGLMAVVELKMPTEKYAKGAVKYLSNNAKSFEDIRIAAAGLETLKTRSPKNALWSAAVLIMETKDGVYGQGSGQARDTASAVVTLLRLEEFKTQNDRALKVLKTGQRKDGGWGKADSDTGSDLESTYRVMRCFIMLKARPDSVDGVRAFLAKCRNEDGGYGIAPGQPSSVGGTYFAAIITHWLKQ